MITYPVNHPSPHCVAIPARLRSTRLEEKLLIEDSGMPLICETISSVRSPDMWPVVVITDHIDIAQAVADYFPLSDTSDVFVHMSGSARNGTERIGRWARDSNANSRFNLMVNVQADEPSVDTKDIAALTRAYEDTPRADVVTMAQPASQADQDSESAVKVRLDANNICTEFSRFPMEEEALDRVSNHVGLYAYSPAFLTWFMRKKTDRHYDLEQQEWMDLGARIRAVLTTGKRFYSVNTRAEYDRWLEVKEARDGKSRV